MDISTTNDAKDLWWHSKYYTKDVKAYWGWSIGEIKAEDIKAIQKIHSSWFVPAPDLKTMPISDDSLFAGEGNTVVAKCKLNVKSKGIVDTLGSAVMDFDKSGLIKKIRWFWDYTYITTKLGLYDPCAKKMALIEEHGRFFNGLQLHQQQQLSIGHVDTGFAVKKDVQTCIDMANGLHVNKNYKLLAWHKKYFTTDAVSTWGSNV